MGNRTSGPDRRPQEALKAQMIDLLRQGLLVQDALKVVGRSTSWWKETRARDAQFRELADLVRRQVAGTERGLAVPDYPEFSEEYLGVKLWDHQLNMFDVLEGRAPRWLDDGMTFHRGVAGHRRVLINVPPAHAKTFTVSIGYILWRLLQDKDMSCLVISKTQAFAAKVLYAIKQRLTSPQYAGLQLAFGPVGGFKDTAEQWSANKVYLWGDERESGSKDPTLEAVGIGGQVYGNRAKLILVDDAIVMSNASDWERQMDWLRQEVATRIGPDDQLAVVGTRVAPVDLYRELLNPEHYNDGEVPWTYLGMPAVLEYGAKPKDWRTLWPVSDQPFSDADQPFDGMNYHRWTGERLAKVRNEIGPRRWALVYLQQSVEEQAIFDAVCVRGSIEMGRQPGPLMPGVSAGVPAGARPYVMLSIDPAMVGNTAFVVYAVDRGTGQRWVLDVKVITGPTPKQMREQIEDLVTRYSPSEVIVEANAYQLALVQDENINRFLASRGVVMKPHYTHSGNKKDEKYGVASMSVLFGTTTNAGGGSKVTHQGDNLLSLPATNHGPGIKKLIDELLVWSPEWKSGKGPQQDCIMAMWFAETRAREIVNTSKRTAFQQGNRFLSERDKARRYTVNLSDLAAARDRGEDLYV